MHGDDTLVVFYKTFASGFSYTRIGCVKTTPHWLRRWDRAASLSRAECADDCKEQQERGMKRSAMALLVVLVLLARHARAAQFVEHLLHGDAEAFGDRYRAYGNPAT